MPCGRRGDRGTSLAAPCARRDQRNVLTALRKPPQGTARRSPPCPEISPAHSRRRVRASRVLARQVFNVSIAAASANRADVPRTVGSRGAQRLELQIELKLPAISSVKRSAGAPQ